MSSAFVGLVPGAQFQSLALEILGGILENAACAAVQFTLDGLKVDAFRLSFGDFDVFGFDDFDDRADFVTFVAMTSPFSFQSIL